MQSDQGKKSHAGLFFFCAKKDGKNGVLGELSDRKNKITRDMIQKITQILKKWSQKSEPGFRRRH